MPPDPAVAQHQPRLEALCREMDRRAGCAEAIEPYYAGVGDDLRGLPPAVVEARLTKVYRNLMPVADAPFGSLVVDAKSDRLEVNGLRDTDQQNADEVWSIMQANGFDAESKLAHGAALLNGRSFATVWPDGEGGASISYDDATQMAVEYAEGSRRQRTAALRRWSDGNRVYATLYEPLAVWKFEGPDHSARSTAPVDWQRREVKGELWPMANPLMPNVPVVELAVNRRLKPGRFGFARGEFEHCVGLIDRINLLTFLGLVVAFWQGFPMRGVIGEKVRRRVLQDDDGEPILDDAGEVRTEAVSPIDPKPDSFFLLTNPEAKLAEYAAADRDNLAIYMELDQLASITKTPRHYFPMKQGMQNLSSETIMAAEGGTHAAITNHQASLGEGHLDTARLVAQAAETELSPAARVSWRPREARSLAEKADAASKLKDGLPWEVIAEIVGLGTMDDIARWTAEQSAGALGQIVAALETPTNGVPAQIG